MPSILTNLYHANVHIAAIRFLDAPELRVPALSLIGNLAVAEPRYVKELVNSGLSQAILGLMSSECTAELLWVLSNLMESIPKTVISWISSEWLEEIIDIAESTSFDMKRECAYFLASAIVFLSERGIPDVIWRAVPVIVDVCGCGDRAVVMRCLDGLLKAAKKSKGSFEPTEIADRLRELVDGSSLELVERAVALQRRLGLA
jgi:hypothetical protein